MFVFFIFVCIVLLSLIIQWLSKRWQVATTIPCGLFILFSSSLFPGKTMAALTLGLPMVFFAGLLGSFLYETRLNPQRHASLESNEHTINSEQQTDSETQKN